MKTAGAVAMVAALAFFPAAAGSTPTEAMDCRETPAAFGAPNAWMASLSTHWLHQRTLWMGYTRADAAFVARPQGQKIAWYRGKGSPWGRLRITGSRLDAEAAPLHAQTGVTYPFREGFQASALTFSTPGCWQVVARVGLRARYVFVVHVEADPDAPVQPAG
ncbi:MAG TPA: hypothetical protein VH950_09200 [Gaiellaceae bacterium]